MNRCIYAETNLGTPRLQPAQRIETDYVVDGGYLENTGILSLAQLWSAAEGRVTRCNTAASAGRSSSTAPTTAPNRCGSSRGSS